MLKAATKFGTYQHYHLISGDDLPIKTQDEIIKFFADYAGTEFIRFESNVFHYPQRTRYYHLFQEKVGRSHNIFIRGGNYAFLTIQKMLHIYRNRDINFQKGTNWFSITDELARYVVSKESWIKKVFKNSFCCDEVFLQTLVANSDYRNNLYHKEFDNDSGAIMRLIDWTRGKPYTFKITDLEELRNSKMLFARKFDERTDSDIIHMIENMVRSER